MNKQTNGQTKEQTNKQTSTCLFQVMLSAGALIEVTCSSKPLWGCFAPAIREVRSTSPLETPEDENSFVIRTSDREFLFRVGSNAEKSSWILGLSHLPLMLT